MSKTVFSSAVRTAATYNSARFRLGADVVGAAFTVNAASESGTSTIDFKIQAYDQLSASYIDVPGASLAQITANGTYRLCIHPALTAVSNIAVSQPLPEMFRAVMTVGGTSFSISVSVEAIKA